MLVIYLIVCIFVKQKAIKPQQLKDLEIMTTKQLKDLTRSQLVKLIKNNQPHLQVRKNMTMQNLRDKLNMLGGNFATISFNKDWVIKNNH